MRIHRRTVVPLVALVAALVPVSAGSGWGQRVTGYSAVEALGLVARTHGAEFVQTIVEMRGVEGQSQPDEWTLTVVDPASPTRLRAFWAGEGRSTDEGVDDEWYPDRLPPGFISRARLRLDSDKAFEAADRLARESLVGFDSLNYRLRARELTNEPLWDVSLVDADGDIVGRFVMSAETGAMLRVVWFDPRGRKGRPTLDTLLEGKPLPGVPATAAAGNTGVVTVEPGAPAPPAARPFDPAAVDPSEFLEPDPRLPGSGGPATFPDPAPAPVPPTARPPANPNPGPLNEQPEVIPVPPDPR